MTMMNPITGNPMTFQQVVSALLVEEFRRTPEEADELVGKYPRIMVNGMMAGHYRSTAMALDIQDSRDREKSP